MLRHFRILEDQTFPKASDDESSPVNPPLCESDTRTPQPTFRHNRRRKNNHSVSKIFSTMELNSLPRKSPRNRTPKRQLLKRKRPRLNFLDSPFSFASGESSSFVSSPNLSSSIDSTRSPRPAEPKKVTPCNPKKYVVPDRPLKQSSRGSRVMRRFHLTLVIFVGPGFSLPCFVFTDARSIMQALARNN